MKKFTKKQQKEFETNGRMAFRLLLMTMQKLKIPHGITSTYKLKNGDTYTLRFEKL